MFRAVKRYYVVQPWEGLCTAGILLAVGSTAVGQPGVTPSETINVSIDSGVIGDITVPTIPSSATLWIGGYASVKRPMTLTVI